MLRGFPAKDYTQLVEILDVSMNGSARVVGTIDRAFVATARLDTRRDRLYVTRSDATGVHNLFAFDLETQTLQALTDNTLQDVGFSGPAILPDGGLLFSQQEGGFSTWLIRFEKAE